MTEPQAQRPYLIGITGTIGAGKSTVGKILESRGIPVIDTDKVVHELLKTDHGAKNAIRDRFGESTITLDENGQETVDRVALGKVVFSDGEARKALEAILHPLVILECRRKVAALTSPLIPFIPGRPLVAILVPLLFEANLESEYDEIWCIYTEEETLRERLKKRDKMSSTEIDNRLATQLPQEEKMRRSKHVIDNSHSESKTAENIDAILLHLNVVQKP